MRNGIACSIRKYSLVGGREAWGIPPHHIYIYLYIHYYNHVERSLCLLLPNEISLLPLIPSFSFVKVLIDFLTIRKYRKKDINKISSEHVEMLYKI